MSQSNVVEAVRSGVLTSGRRSGIERHSLLVLSHRDKHPSFRRLHREIALISRTHPVSGELGQATEEFPTL